MTPKSGPGMVLGDLGAPFGVLRAIFKEFLRRLARRWAQDGRSWGPSWEQVATKMGQDSAKLAILGSTWEVLGAFWEYFGTWAGWQKTYKNLRKTFVFRYFGELEEVAEALFWRCWLQDGIFRAS